MILLCHHSSTKEHSVLVTILHMVRITLPPPPGKLCTNTGSFNHLVLLWHSLSFGSFGGCFLQNILQNLGEKGAYINKSLAGSVPSTLSEPHYAPYMSDTCPHWPQQVLFQSLPGLQVLPAEAPNIMNSYQYYIKLYSCSTEPTSRIKQWDH